MNTKQKALMHKARAHQNNQEWTLAITSYKDLLEQLSDNGQLWHELGLAYVQVENMQGALCCLTKAHELLPCDYQILNNLGNVQQSLQQWDIAERSYTLAIEIKPRYAEAWHNLARLHCSLQRPMPAIEAWKEALHIQPDYHDAHFSLGLLFLQNNLLHEANVQFKNVLQLNPDNINAHFYSGVIALNDEQLTTAEQHFNTVLKHQHEHIEALVNMGVVLLKKEQAQEAINYFSKALVCDNNHIEARNNLAATFMYFDRYENALQHYSVLLDDDPMNIEYLYNCGVAQMALGHLAQAEQCFELVMQQNSGHFASLNNLAAIAIRQEQREKAVHLLKKALQINPSDTISQHMLSSLQGTHYNQKACPEYARNLFDNYALYYDKHLRETLSYEVPEQIAQILRDNSISNVNCTLDLGCGSGLSGEALRSMTAVLDGVDISPKMLLQAKNKSIYDALIEQEIIHYLQDKNDKYSLIVAADVLPYFGCLSVLFPLLRQQLEDNGHVVITHEQNSDTPWLLQDNGRFSHQSSYVTELAEQSGLDIVQCKSINGRTQAQKPIAMKLLLLKKAATSNNNFSNKQNESAL